MIKLRCSSLRAAQFFVYLIKTYDQLMRNIFLSFLVLNISVVVCAQSLEVNGGYIINHFHDFGYDEGHYKSEYKNGPGYGFEIGIEDLRYDIFRFRFTLGFNHYSGEFSAYNGGLGGGGTTEGSVDKSLIYFGLYPLSFNIINRIDLNFGIDFGILINENFKGSRSSWVYSQPMEGTYYKLEDEYDRFSSIWYVGFSTRIAYNIRVSDVVAISPQYKLYLGLSPEFDHFPDKTKSLRHYFSLGVKIKLRKDK